MPSIHVRTVQYPRRALHLWCDIHRKEVMPMTQALQTRPPGMVEPDAALPPSLDLIRVLDEVDQASAPREEAPRRLMPAPTRPPRPFAYD